MNATRKVAIGVVAAVVLIGGWAAFRPELLFVNQRVDEAFPAAMAATSGGEPETLLSGMFRGAAHKTEGTATIHKLDNGKRVLRLTGFETSNGPDVRVLLVAAPDVRDNATVKKAGFVDLGAIKGNQGDQNYDVPMDLDLERYRSVTIWCRRFGVNFGSAPLSPGESMASTGPREVAKGEFKSGAHETKGLATVFDLGDRRIVRLTGFHTSNGPDVRVLLVAAPEVKDNATVKKAGFVDLGAIKGNQGDQNYEVPAGVDVSHYRSVTIWCRRFGVNFGSASLNGGQEA